MSSLGAWRLNSAESEEFMAAVARQSIGRLSVVRPSKNLEGKVTNPICPPFPCDLLFETGEWKHIKSILGPTEQRVDGVKASLSPIVSTTSVNRGPPRDSIFNNQISSLGAANVRVENKMAMAQIPVPTEKSYARPADPAPGPSRHQMTIAGTTLSSSLVPLRQGPTQQPREIPTVAATAYPTTTAHRLVQGERICQPQLPQAVPLRDLADRWARELDAARERRKQLREQFRRDFGTGYYGHS